MFPLDTEIHFRPNSMDVETESGRDEVTGLGVRLSNGRAGIPPQVQRGAELSS